MTTIHMQTETVRSTAQQMAQNAAQADGELLSLQRTIQELGFTWRGGDSEEFSTQAQDLLPRLRTQCETLALLAERVKSEVAEWEQVDQRGAAAMNSALAGGVGNSNASGQSMSMAAAVSVASLLAGLPAWLSSFLDRFFPSPEIVSPLADESTVLPSQNQTTTDLKQKSPFGELLEKAEKEKQELESKKPVETPKPEYLSQFPVREDDGSFLTGQEKDDSCSIASTKMALQRAVGVDASESDLRTASSKVDGGYENNAKKWGTNPSTLDDLVNDQYGDVATANYVDPGSQSISDLEQAASDGEGIVVSVRNSEWFGSARAHSVTVVGVETQNGLEVVLVNDPWPPGKGKRLAIPTGDFERAWYGDAMYISENTKE